MRKSLLTLLLVLALSLCACANTQQVDTSTEGPPAAVTTAKIISSENSAGAISTDAVSIVFAGKPIIAPGYYPDVPDAYIPVLDDLYLSGELRHQYSILNYEDKITKELMQEYAIALSVIRGRGFLPYPGDGLGIDGGYALIDLDADGIFELLILDDSSHYNQKLDIKAVFAIRNGQLVCIDDGSAELDDAILSTDNTFYRCIDWRAEGYADLITFRLEAGMTEFTTISEAHAALSFAEGDVPVPYWFTIEGGNETSITEDEFQTLLAQYKAREDEMLLEFVPLHPDAVDPWSVPHPTDKPLIIPIEYPEAYQDAPKAYKPILDALLLLEHKMRLDVYSEEDDLGTVGFVEYPYLHDTELGYALVDLNEDGILELLLGTTSELNNAVPNSIFTLIEGQPVLLKFFWSRSYGILAADGIIYSEGSDGAAYTILSSYQFEKNADSLTQLTDMRSDYYAEMDYFFQVIEGRNHYISEQEFDGFCELYSNPPKRMQLTVMPIAQ